jgi:hypothetical protein
MPPVKRRVFKDLVPPAIQQQYAVGIRHDVVDKAGDGWHYGWKGIHAVDLEAAVQEN